MVGFISNKYNLKSCWDKFTNTLVFGFAIVREYLRNIKQYLNKINKIK